VTRFAALWLIVLVAAAVPAAAAGGRGHKPTTITEIGGFSAQASPNHAVVEAHVAAHTTRPAQKTASAHVADVSTASSPPPVPTLSSDSSLLKNPHPMGPGTLWYQGPPGQQCIYAPSTSPLCFAVVQPNGARLDPALIAAQLARTMDLVLPPIEASPSASRRGLTGDQTWFWLARRPTRNQATVNLGSETVTITADPSATEWFFGDGGGRAGGPGVAYQPGPPPADAITHVYDTRCLPGDQGRDPNVLPSCGGDGYQVVAQVSWTTSFAASGPVAASGGLPARTTESELVYPVSEARAFLAGGSS
jgi:hypothetical protein